MASEQVTADARLYIGDMYLVSTSREHIRVLTGHFDNLIRAAVMQPPEVIVYLKRLLSEAVAHDRSNRATPVSA